MVMQDAAKFPNCLLPAAYRAVNAGAWWPKTVNDRDFGSRRKKQLIDGLGRTPPSSYIKRIASLFTRGNAEELIQDAGPMIVWMATSGADLLEDYVTNACIESPMVPIQSCLDQKANASNTAQDILKNTNADYNAYFTHRCLWEFNQLPIDQRSHNKDIISFWVAHWVLMIEPLPDFGETDVTCTRTILYTEIPQRVLYTVGKMVMIADTPVLQPLIDDDLDEMKKEAEFRQNRLGLTAIPNDNLKTKTIYKQITGHEWADENNGHLAALGDA